MKFGMRELVLLIVLLAIPVASLFLVFKPQNVAIERAKKEIEHKERTLDKLKEQVVRQLDGLRCGPFYGCYILRPSRILGMEEHPERDNYLEQIIEAVGATAVQYEGQDKCCGFPILTNNRKNSLTQAGTHIGSAKDQGADCLVTPCPLCHLNLDAQQPSAAEVIQRELNVPIIHLPQLLGLAIGIDPKLLRMNRHVVGTQAVLDKVMAAVDA